jgi:hypothetical protein
MADNYTHGSFTLPLRSTEEAEWMAAFLQEVDEQLAAEEEPTNGVAEYLRNLGSECRCNNYVRRPEGEKKYLWVYGDEQFDVEEAALVVMAYLKRWAPKACFVFTWADTCSKPRPGEFSGGSVLVNVEDWYVVGPQMQRTYLIEDYGVGLEVLDAE